MVYKDYLHAQSTPKNAQTLLEQEYGTLYTKERVKESRLIDYGTKSWWTHDWKDKFSAL